jgi:hypothetical protein
MFVLVTAAPGIYNLGHAYQPEPLLKCTHLTHQWLFVLIIHRMFGEAAK